MEFVNERIHRIPQSDLSILEHRLAPLSGPGTMSSFRCSRLCCLYFERVYESTAFESRNSMIRKDEFRITYVNQDMRRLQLEKKTASDGMSGIDSCEIPLELVETILRGSYSDIVRDSQGRTGEELDPLIQEFYWEVIGRGLRPRVVVDYDTKPYYYAQGDAQVTMNFNPKVNYDPQVFLDPNHKGMSMKVNEAIVHVKWNHVLPDIVRTAFSAFGNTQNRYHVYFNMM